MLVTELYRLEVILDSFQGKYTVRQAAEKLGVTERRVNQLRDAIRQQGCEAIQYFPTKMERNNDLILMWNENANKKISILEFQRMLEEQGTLKKSYSSVYRLLRKEKMFSPYHKGGQKELPSGNVFLVIQPKNFLLPRINTKYYLYIILDVSGCITGMYLNEEKKFLCMKMVLAQTLEKYGIPETIYLQAHNILLNKNHPEGVKFYKSMNELGIIVRSMPWEYQSAIEDISGMIKHDIALLFQEKQVDNEIVANELLASYMQKVNEKQKKIIDLEKSVFVPVIDKSFVKKWLNDLR